MLNDKRDDNHMTENDSTALCQSPLTWSSPFISHNSVSFLIFIYNCILFELHEIWMQDEICKDGKMNSCPGGANKKMVLAMTCSDFFFCFVINEVKSRLVNTVHLRKVLFCFVSPNHSIFYLRSSSNMISFTVDVSVGLIIWSIWTNHNRNVHIFRFWW